MNNFYDYYDPKEIIDFPFLAAAQSLLDNGLHVIPLKVGAKTPHDMIKDIGKIRQNPINNHNVEFFFARDGVDIGIMLRKNMEVIDVDSKNKEGLSEAFIFALRHGWQELYDKLVISRTPTGGLHILYTSELIGGDTVLARKNASPHPVGLIERISESNKNYIKCCPSIGYTFIQGNPIDMPYLDAEERTWLCGLAASFNELIIPEATKVDSERSDSPWTVYNEKNDWQWILSELKDRGWGEIMDLNDKVILKRPGASPQHSAYLWKDSNTLYVFSSSSEFTPEKSYTPFGVYCHLYHDNNIASACKALAKEGIGNNIFEEGKFWKRNKKRIDIKYTEITEWLYLIGYRFYKNQIVKITDNIISILDEKKLKAAFINEIEYEMTDYFYNCVAGIFADNGGIMAMMSELDDKFIKDTKSEIWLFFKNYAVKITDTDILPIIYKELNGYIWEGGIINRNFYNGEFDKCDAERFVNTLGGIKSDNLKKLLGYSISRFKDPVNPKAVILTEDIDPESEGESQGGSGKGLLFAFVRQFRKVTDFDGKSFNPSANFIFQNVDADTNILFIDDLDKYFKFTSLFSIMTGALPVNKKQEKQMLLPFDSSPKIFITSNYNVGNDDISSRRRKHEFSVVKHYGIDIEPIDDFGRQFFTEWDTDEWCRFDNFMSDCCRLYLKETDKKSIGNVTERGKERSLMANTNSDFVAYMDGQLVYNFFDFCPMHLKTDRGTFNNNTVTNAPNISRFKDPLSPDDYFVITKEIFLEGIQKKTKNHKLSTTKLTQWIKQWAKARNVEIDTSYKQGAAGDRSYRIVNFVPIIEKNEVDEVGKKVGSDDKWEEQSDFGPDEIPTSDF